MLIEIGGKEMKKGKCKDKMGKTWTRGGKMFLNGVLRNTCRICQRDENCIRQGSWGKM